MKPLFTLEPEAGYIFNAQWSQTRPLVFFLSTENGKLLIYDLKVIIILQLFYQLVDQYFVKKTVSSFKIIAQ